MTEETARNPSADWLLFPADMDLRICTLRYARMVIPGQRVRCAKYPERDMVGGDEDRYKRYTNYGRN